MFSLASATSPFAGFTELTWPNPFIIVSGANLCVVNGLGQTNSKNGLGNICIGYQELAGPFVPDYWILPNGRSGSHNLIVGEANQWTSFGSLVAGALNVVSGEDASTIGGEFSVAGATASVVIGGTFNQIQPSSGGSVIINGIANTAVGAEATILSGYNNTTKGLQDTLISTRSFTTVTNGYSFVLGAFGSQPSGQLQP
jgi:hypothetical protein